MDLHATVSQLLFSSVGELGVNGTGGFGISTWWTLRYFLFFIIITSITTSTTTSPPPTTTSTTTLTSTFTDLTGEITTEGYKQEEETTLDALNDAPSPATATSIASEEGFTTSPSTTTTTTLTSNTTPAATATSNAFEEDFTTTEVNAEQPVSLGSEVEGESTTENIFEEDTSDDFFEDEVMVTETATHHSEEETLTGVSLPETKVKWRYGL